jgi:hypothetical protein
MKLYPAIQTPDGVITGKENDSHASLIKEKKLTDISEPQKGFTPNGKIFLTRLDAIWFLKKYDPMVYKKIKDEFGNEGLHTSLYAKATGIELKEVEEEPEESTKEPPEADPEFEKGLTEI